MQCKQVREHLSAYLDRELTAELATAVRHHLASCPECRAMLEELRATADLLGRLPAQQAPEGLADDVMRQVEQRMLAPQAAGETPMQERTLAVHRARPWPRVLAVAACVALAAGIGLVAFFGAHPFEQPGGLGLETHARHEALDAPSRLKLGSEFEARTAALPKRGSVAAGETVGEDLALGNDWFFSDERGGQAAGDGLDLRLGLEETPTTDLHALGTERDGPGTDLYAWTDGLGRTASRTGRRGEVADKAATWAMKEADEPPPGHFYYDFNGLLRPAPYGPVAKATHGGDADGDAVALGDSGAHLAFGVRAKDAAGRAAPAEVLLGEKRSRSAARLGGAGVALVEEGGAGSADEKATAVAGLRVARGGVEPEPAPPETDAAAELREHAGTLTAKAAPTTRFDVTEAVPDEMSRAAEHRMAEAGPATTPKAPAVGAGIPDLAVPGEPADPQIVQMAMNTVAVGQAPVASLRRVATVDNLDRNSNQLVVRGRSRATANRELVHLFGRNGWRELDERADADRARKKAPAEHPVLPGFATATGGQAGGVYYLAHRNGEDLWVVLTTADDLSRFATQVAQSRTMQVGADSSRPFQAVHYLQQQLALFEAEASARRSASSAGTGMAGKAAVPGGAAAGKMAGGTVSRSWVNERVTVPAKEAPRKGDVSAAEVEAEEAARQPVRGVTAGRFRGDRHVNGPAAEPRRDQAAWVPAETAPKEKRKAEGEVPELQQREAAPPAPEPQALGRKDEEGTVERLQAFQHGKTKPAAEKPSEEAAQAAAQPAAETEKLLEAAQARARPEEGLLSEAARQKPAQGQPLTAEMYRAYGFLRTILPNQIMLVVRVRSADEPPHAAEAVQTQVETAEPAEAEHRAAPAAKE